MEEEGGVAGIFDAKIDCAREQRLAQIAVGPSRSRFTTGTPARPSASSIISPINPPSRSIFEPTTIDSAPSAGPSAAAMADASTPLRVRGRRTHMTTVSFSAARVMPV